MTRAWLVAFALAAVLPAQAQKTSSPADPERQLQAIRQALVESTLAAPVRVQSFGWIDSEGRLHESTQFSSDTRVRGVRVQSYVEDSSSQPRVVVDSIVLPAGLGTQAQADPERCMVSQRRWRQSLHVEVIARHRLPGLLPVEQTRAAMAIQQAFVAAARDSHRWRAQARPPQATSAYEQAVGGRDMDRTEWLARIELLDASAGFVDAAVEVMPAGRPGEARRVQMSVPVIDGEPMEPAMAKAVSALDRQSACEPLWFSVVGQGDALRLREGAVHGLRPGDRLLLVERQHLPGRLLEPGAARGIALVQAGPPSAHGTPLYWLAGPRPQSLGDWVALPL